MSKRILFCNDVTLTKKLGASKVVVELAEGMSQQGWDCRLAGPEEISPGLEHLSGLERLHTFADNLKTYLLHNADEYDVVDYPHQYLPFPRQEFPAQPLFVARSVLLTHFLDSIPIPAAPGWRNSLGNLIHGGARRNYNNIAIERATQTMREADLVNVSNDLDKDELLKYSIPGDKIVVLPFGISRSRRPLFEAVSTKLPEEPIVAFVGTFDYRKGAREFPQIVESIAQKVPGVKFHLLGTKGLYQTAHEVLACFPPRLAGQVQVTPEYAPEDLPALLRSCSVGIFPSHIEGFGFGVLEMLAAAVPVIAYNAPGPPMMLPNEYLVPRGDAQGMACKVAELLNDKNKLQEARIWAQQRSRIFDWQEIAKNTSDIYLERLS